MSSSSSFPSFTSKQSRSFTDSHTSRSASSDTNYNHPAIAGDGRFELLLKLKLAAEKSERESANHDHNSESLRLAHRANVHDNHIRMGLMAYCERALADARFVMGKVPKGKTC